MFDFLDFLDGLLDFTSPRPRPRPIPTILPEAHVPTLRELVTAKGQTAGAVSASQAKLVKDQQAVADDQVQLASDTTADQTAGAAIASALPPLGFAVDPTVNRDGTLNLYIKDTSAAGYHVIPIPTIDAETSNPAPPDVTVPPPAPDQPPADNTPAA